MMYYLNKESLLKKGEYLHNVKIGLNFLLNFIHSNHVYERYWTSKTKLIQNMDISSIECDSMSIQELKKEIKNEFPDRTQIFLSQLIEILLQHHELLETWLTT